MSRIHAVDGDRLLIRPPIDGEGRLPTEPGTPLEVGWLGDGGVQWHAGVAVGYDLHDGDEALVVRLLDAGVQAQRREHPRAKVALALEAWPLIGGEPVPGRVLDIGVGGLRVELPVALGVGDVVQMAIRIPDEAPIRLSARVYRAEPGVFVFTYELFAAGTRERLVDAAFRLAAA
jgi:hypothetical protein